MFENLSQTLEGAFKSLSGNNKITDLNIAAAIKEIRRALVAADVNYKIAKEFTDKVRDKAMGQGVLQSVSPGQQMVKIVNDELVELMGGQSVGINIKGNPAVVLIAGLQGSGKTTFTGKLSYYLKNDRKKKVLVAACDVYRPAAILQLSVLAEQVGAGIYKEEDSKNPVQIAKNAIAHGKQNGYDVVIIDTAGRLAIDEDMMNEIAAVKAAITPDETLFVVDAMTGQDAVNTALAFNNRINFDGVVLTKLDGDTRGGAALSVKYTVGKPIKFVSTGEKMEALDIFYPERMATRILGMGDVVSLVERAQAQFDEEDAKRIEKRLKQNKFDFNDFLGQLAQLKKMGNLKDLISMIPGASKMIPADLDLSNESFKRLEAIIYSMTPKERLNPELLADSKRKKRLAKGSGNDILQVNAFLKQFEEMRKVMFMASQGKLPGMGGMPVPPRGGMGGMNPFKRR
jgi:signal recognition particle subunit SRP54